ncbi:MoaD/ThiS family protein [Methanimicrococcus sp. OttesenSCG-928-J09]|nr:MoaD/ThiS family protein [Methanimicrococcus sp. OttesenSCG-928-J09]
MKISISIFGTRADCENKADIVIPEAATLKDLITEFSLKYMQDADLILDKDGNLRKHLIIQVNKKRVMVGKVAEYELADGDEVTIYPPVSGG